MRWVTADIQSLVRILQLVLQKWVDDEANQVPVFFKTYLAIAVLVKLTNQFVGSLPVLGGLGVGG